MKILFVTSEASPYFKTGGLADVSRSLPDALRAAGHEVRILMPLYGSIRGAVPAGESDETTVPWPSGPVRARFVLHEPPSGAPAVLIDQPVFFEAGAPYEAAAHDPLDAGRRFAFFSRCIVRYASLWKPDVIHLNDWTTGLAPAYALVDGLECATVFAIHNLGYQGNFPPALLGQIGIPPDLYRTENGIEFMGAMSFMKSGIALSDRVVTVSPTYALEIQTPMYGGGLDGLLRFRRRVLHGILNGIDMDVWDPTDDRHIAATYKPSKLEGKRRDRDALIAETGLDTDGPVFAMIGRLVHQKGVDLVIGALPAILDAGARLVVLGSGERGFERDLVRAARSVPDRIAVFPRFDEPLAHRIYAGADFLLMPSRYEPCGLGQMIAQRYGTPPVVRHTGGLVDTVIDGRTGFVFDEPTPAAVAQAVGRAARVHETRGWNALRRRCMRLDWSWARSASLYEDVYRAAHGLPAATG
jgi:starch synthase